MHSLEVYGRTQTFAIKGSSPTFSVNNFILSLVQTATTELPSHLLESLTIAIFAPLSKFDDYKMSPKLFRKLNVL
jgi:hypothetical protein